METCERMRLTMSILPCGETEMCNGCVKDNVENKLKHKTLYKRRAQTVPRQRKKHQKI